MAMAGSKRLHSSTFAMMGIMVLCTSCILTPFSAADDVQSSSTSPVVPSAAGVSGDVSVPSATQPATTAALPPSSAAATVSKKFPLPGAGGGGGEYFPAAEVATALPVPTPDELPSAASLGFGGHGDECCGGGGYGWFGGPGGFGPGTYGYNGPLYFGAAPAGNIAAANVLVPLVVACVSAALFV